MNVMQAAQLALLAKEHRAIGKASPEKGIQALVLFEQPRHGARTAGAAHARGWRDGLGSLVALGPCIGDECAQASNATVRMRRDAASEHRVELTSADARGGFNPLHGGSRNIEPDRLDTRQEGLTSLTLQVARIDAGPQRKVAVFRRDQSFHGLLLWTGGAEMEHGRARKRAMHQIVADEPPLVQQDEHRTTRQLHIGVMHRVLHVVKRSGSVEQARHALAHRGRDDTLIRDEVRIDLVPVCNPLPLRGEPPGPPSYDQRPA